MKKTIITAVFFLGACSGFSQSVSSSPYAIYGLGSLYEANFGVTGGIGSSGMALPSESSINNRNPASLAFIGKNSFFFEMGGSGILSSYEDSNSKESKQNAQFSHFAFAFPVTSKSGGSVSLQPYSSASYEIKNLKFPILNSTESYSLDADSKGGLNNLEFSYGYRTGKKMTFGLTASLLFGNIVDNKTFTISSTATTISRESYYTGLRFVIGNQYMVDSTLSFGARIKLPTRVAAAKTQSVYTTGNSGNTSLEDAVNSASEDFYLPFEMGVGIRKNLFKKVEVTFDYDKSLWSSVNQSELYGSYKNQDRFALGVSYEKKDSNRFVKKVRYSAGLNYDSGFLKIGSEKVNNMAFSAGIGFPIERTRSYLNLSYSYGQQGKIGEELIKESYHKIGINLSLEGIWFVKRKID